MIFLGARDRGGLPYKVSLSSFTNPKSLECEQSRDRIFLFLEYCAGGDLSAYIRRTKRVKESTAQHFMRQLGARFHPFASESYAKGCIYVYRAICPYAICKSVETAICFTKLSPDSHWLTCIRDEVLTQFFFAILLQERGCRYWGRTTWYTGISNLRSVYRQILRIQRYGGDTYLHSEVESV